MATPPSLKQPKDNGVTMTVDGMDSVRLAIEALTKRHVLIGIPAEDAMRDPEDGTDITNAQIGYINEFGLPEKNIPARPHLLPGVKDTFPETIKRFKKAADEALSGNVKAVDAQMNAVGLKAVSNVRARITGTLTPPLSPRTIYNRQHRTDRPQRMGTQPLIDFGDYLRAITYVLRKVK